MSEKTVVTGKDEKLLRRFYGDEWEKHTDELLTVFDYSDAATKARQDSLAGLSKEERLLKAIFSETPEWKPNIERAEELIASPLQMLAEGTRIDLGAVSGMPELYETCKKVNDFADVLRGVLDDDETNPTNWHLEPVELEGEPDKYWAIKDKEGKFVLKMFCPTSARALAFLLLEWPHDIDAWLDYAGLYMYDGVNGKDLRKQ